MFDKDGGGTIDPAELRDIVHGLFCLAGIEAPDEILDIRSQVRGRVEDVERTCRGRGEGGGMFHDYRK